MNTFTAVFSCFFKVAESGLLEKLTEQEKKLQEVNAKSCYLFFFFWSNNVKCEIFCFFFLQVIHSDSQKAPQWLMSVCFKSIFSDDKWNYYWQGLLWSDQVHRSFWSRVMTNPHIFLGVQTQNLNIKIHRKILSAHQVLLVFFFFLSAFWHSHSRKGSPPVS